MKDEDKTKEELISELLELRQRITELEGLEAKYKRTEEEIRESEEKLSAMLLSISDHVSMMDKDLNIIWANETAKKVFGDDIIGKKCFEAYHQRKEPCEPYPCLTLQAFQDEKVHQHDTQVLDSEGRVRHFNCTANVALKDPDGNPTAVIEISSDITEAKKAEAALRESMPSDKLDMNLRAARRGLEEARVRAAVSS